MDRNEAASVIQRFLTCRDICRDECCGYCETCRYNTEYDEKTEALKLAIATLEQAPTALDHIHTVVAKMEYQRGYKTAKEEYDHKLTEIRGRIKDYYFNNGYDAGHNEGYERGKEDAAISASTLARRLTAKFDDVLSVADVLEELEALEAVAKGE